MGADENILNSSRSTDFMTPKNEQSRAFRNAVLELSSEHEFVRPFINSGRLSMPTPYHGSPLSTADVDDWKGGPQPGHPCVDAPVHDTGTHAWLLRQLGDQFKLLHFGPNAPETELPVIQVGDDEVAVERYDARYGATYLIRPDQVVAARWKRASHAAISEAYQRAIGNRQ